MSNEIGPPDDSAVVGRAGSPKHPLVLALILLLSLECVAISAAAVYLIVEVFISEADSLIGALALAGSVAIAAIWVVFIVVGVARGRAWTRAAAIVVQVLIGAIAIGSIQGSFGRPDIAWLLLIPAVAVVALLFTKPVLTATSGRER